MTQKNHRVGLLGAGYIVEAHVKAVRALPNTTLAAVCDVSKSRAEAAAAAHGIPGVFTSVQDMLRSGVDAVHVLVPPQLHTDLARQVLEGGAHALIEKPMGTSAAACHALADLAEARGLRLAVSHNFLFMPAYERLRAHLRDGTIGRLDHVSLRWLYPLGLVQFGPFNNWILRAEPNVLLELGSHLAAFMVDLVGIPEELHAIASNPIDLPGAQRVFRHWSVLARKGPTGISFELSATPGQVDRSVSVRGLAACARMDFERNTLLVEEAKVISSLFDALRQGRASGAEMRRQAWSNFGRQFTGTLKKGSQANPFYDSVGNAVAAFYRGIDDGKLDPRLDARFGARVIGVCEQIMQSAGVAAAAASAAKATLPAVATPKPATVLVIGGTGFIGKRLVRALLAAGHGVRVLSRSIATAAYELEGLPVEVAEGALHDAKAVTAAMQGIDVVYHLGKATGQRWQDYLEQDVEPTRVVAQCAIDAGVRRFIYTGTIDSYDSARDGSVIDGKTPLDASIDTRNLYARSKAACEALLLAMHRDKGLPLVIFRPGIVIGEGCPPAHWGVGMFHSDSRVEYWGDGNNKLPLVLVDDVAAALVLAHDAPQIEGRSFLLTDDPLLTAREYVDAVSEHSQTRMRATPTPIWRFAMLDAAKEAVKHAIRHPNRKRWSYHDWACRRHIARYDSAATREALGWKPAGTREAIIEKGIVAAVRRYMR
jgi:predicted dehydrogenase/nucleoside-diphosphate-sugar epimerase